MYYIGSQLPATFNQCYNQFNFREENRQSIMGNRIWCRHFNDFKNKTCKAGVSFTDVCYKDESTKDNLIYPCFKNNNHPIQCDKQEWCSQKEVDDFDDLDETVKACFKLLFARIEAGFCFVCNQPIEYMVQVGRSMYAHPCGHRQGQGYAQIWNMRKGKNAPKDVLP